MLQHAPLERAELGRGLEAELVEGVACLPVGGQGVGLLAGAVEGEHALRLQPLAVGMRGDERSELADERSVPPPSRSRPIRASSTASLPSSSRAAAAWAKGS